eukprot:CAMPEP_0206394884 /NCGR_PEP_ID=MMETSP0294-20121207/21685_1 /ASSEMBLY_ACC=CAM_ASM_000327 /TAXON_ID=39354 /ORGANISM="Heterosigma akashiwo, Strain CCMP2393" /LENGTH=443 /DNA_ID=CAMNT_0053848969 /DNA_START=11 /DNA_END=1342 /DNA_ORIENTATION=-
MHSILKGGARFLVGKEWCKDLGSCAVNSFLVIQKSNFSFWKTWDDYTQCTKIQKICSSEAGGPVSVQWADGHISVFPVLWLIDNSPESFDAETKQRMASRRRLWAPQSISNCVLVPSETDDQLAIHWGNGNQKQSFFSCRWLRENCPSVEASKLRPLSDEPREITLWDSTLLEQDNPPIIEHDEVMESGDEGTYKMMQFLARYGIVFIKDVPTTVEGTQRLSERIGPIKNTLYGGMWSTRAASDEEETFNDTAYGNAALPMHTDGTYFHDPPGLQVFNCAVPGAGGTGASRFLDGHRAAADLRARAPWAFRYLSYSASFEYQCHDQRCHLRASGPIFKLNAHGKIIQVRHNDTDQLPLGGRPTEEVELFYRAHRELMALLEGEGGGGGLALERVLARGEAFVLDNHRVLHGRRAFRGERRMIGCYIGRDEFTSHARYLGLWNK